MKECYEWGILGCGWLGQAFAHHLIRSGVTVWGSARSQESLKAITQLGAHAVAFNADTDPTNNFPPCENLLVAWPPGVGAQASARAIQSGQSEHTQWTVCISSTSVYPKRPAIYTEEQAERRVSPHSGVCVLDIEAATGGKAVSHLRAGGLIGPGRPLLRKTRRISSAQKTLNVVHIEDVIAAIEHTAHNRLEGAFNLVSPIKRTRQACEDMAAEATATMKLPETNESRTVSSQRLLDTGFDFQHPDPAFFPNLFA